MKFAILFGVSLLAHSGASPDVFVDLFEWTWPDVEKECVEFLGPKGFKAVQIAPPEEHPVMFDENGRWYERYQPVSHKLISRSGNEEQLKSMIRTCKEAGVSIYVDAVFNHMGKGQTGCGKGFAGTPYCNRSYAMYEPKDFHHKPGDVMHNCNINFAASAKNWTAGGDPQPLEMWYCDLIGLPDLNTENDHVQDIIAGHLAKLLKFGADGLRIDAAKHMPPEDIHQILDKAQKFSGKHPQVVLELFSNETKPVKPSMYLGDGRVEYFQYQKKISGNIAMVPEMGGRLDRLRHIEEEFPYPSDNTVVFLDNHDTQRGPWAILTYRKPELYTLATIFMLAHPYGYPKVMSSFYIPNNATGGPGVDQGPPTVPVHDHDKLNCLDGKTWVCEHRITAIANMVKWRKVAGHSLINYWADENGDRIAFARGPAFLAMNRNESMWTTFLQTGLPAGKYCDVFQSDSADSCPYVEVDGQGIAVIQVPGLSAVIFHVEAKASSMTTRLSATTNTSSLSIFCVFLFFTVALAALIVKSMHKRPRHDDGYSNLSA